MKIFGRELNIEDFEQMESINKNIINEIMVQQEMMLKQMLTKQGIADDIKSKEELLEKGYMLHKEEKAFGEYEVYLLKVVDKKSFKFKLEFKGV